MTRDFPAWMDRLAHDLRGPLSPMQTAVFLLRDGRISETERVELLDVIDRQSRRLGGMIDEVADWVRAERGRLIVRREEVELALLLGDIGTRLGGPAPEFVFAPGAHDVQLHGDPLRLGQLLRTFIGFGLTRGAVAPGPTIHIGLQGDRLHLSRSLSSPGTATARAASLLDTPLDEPADEGLGIGLIVAQAIAHAHAGELRASAADGDTVELALELPASVVPGS